MRSRTAKGLLHDTWRVAHVERIVPDETEPGIVALHLRRYEFALPWCAGKEVLDAACGVGYGAAVLARAARRVVGVDLDEEALEYARQRYAAPNVEFVRMDVAELSFPPASFDAVCSFETVEHLDEPEAFVAAVARVLRPGGAFLVSTPRADTTTRAPANPHHRVELSLQDFEALLRGQFREVVLYGLAQRLDLLGLRKRTSLFRPLARRLLGTPATAELTVDDVVISRDDLETATELLAVCH
jgi:SAM-dependent methyltransferase